MRKKFLLIAIVILLLSCAIATSFAIDNRLVKSDVNENSFEMGIVSPNSLYMPLNSPQLVAVNADYTAVVSTQEIAVYNKGDYYKIPLVISADSIIKSLALAEQYLIILCESSSANSTSLMLWNLQSKTQVNTDFQTVLGADNAALRIDSDGNKFYVHNSAMELIEISVNDDVLTNQKLKFNSLTMANATLFDIYQGQLYTYNAATQQICSVQKDSASQRDVLTVVYTYSGITNFKITTDGIAYSADNKINYYSLSSTNLSTPYAALNTVSMCVFNETVYFCDTANNRVKLLNIGAAIQDSGLYYGDSGNEIGRYNAPNDLAAFNDKIYIADTNNSRISIFDTNTLNVSIAPLEFKPLKIAVYGEKIAIYDGESICLYSYTGEVLTRLKTVPFSVYGKVKSLIYHYNQLYALNDTGVTYLIGESAVKIHENAAAKAILSNSNSNYIYVVADKLIKLNVKTFNEDISYDFDFSNAANVVVDYSGNLFASNLEYSKLSAYARENGEYVFQNQYDLDRISSNSRMVMDVQTGDIYVVDKTLHKLVFIKAEGINSSSLNDVKYNSPTSDLWTIIEAGTVNENTFTFTAPNNDEAVEDLSEGSIFLTLCSVNFQDTLYAYGVVKGKEDKFCYIKADKLDAISKVQYAENHPTMTAVFPSGATVREFPLRSAKVLGNAKRPIELKVIDNVAGEYNNHVWQWYKVTYKNEDGAIITGYVERDDIYYSSAITPPKNRVFLKVQTEGIGKTIKVYKEPNAAAEVLFDNVSDGEKVILGDYDFDKSSEFTKVIYNNTTGYIYTSYLIQTGLTSSQVVTIVVSVVCVVIFIVLIVLLLLRKKLFNKTKTNTSKSKKNN